MVKSGKQSETPVNDLIFKELLKRGYSLEGNTRVWNIADSKLWYLTPGQAKSYLEAVEKAPDYKAAMIDKEIDLLRKSMPDISKHILTSSKELIMIDIGCGDGKKAVVPIEYLQKQVKIIYCPIDISSYMVQKAIENIKHHLKILELIEDKKDIKSIMTFIDLFKQEDMMMKNNLPEIFELKDSIITASSKEKNIAEISKIIKEASKKIREL